MPDDFNDEPRRSRYRDSLPAKPARPREDDEPPPRRPRLIGFYRPNEDEKNSAMLCHLLAIFLHFIGPIIIWASKKQESRFADWHGREALNFSINMAIWAIAAAFVLTILAIVTCGFAGILFPLIFCINIYQIVMNIIALNAGKRGEWYRYPLIFRMIPPPEGMESLDSLTSDEDADYAPLTRGETAARPSEPAQKGSLLWVWLLAGTAVLLIGGCCTGGIVYALVERTKKIEKVYDQVNKSDNGPLYMPKKPDDANAPPIDLDPPKPDMPQPGGPPQPAPPPRRDNRPKRAEPPRDPIEKALDDVKSASRADRLRALEVLGKSGDKRAPKALAEALKDLSLRKPTIEALKQYGSEAEDEVAALLNGTDTFTKQAACEALKEIGTKKSMPALRPLTSDRSRFVSKAATDAVDAIKARMP